LLVQVAAFIREFYDKFRHLPVFLSLQPGPPLLAQSNIPASHRGCSDMLKPAVFQYRK